MAARDGGTAGDAHAPATGAGGLSEIFAPGLLAGKVALVTGGGTGLGRETALELARCGAHVTIAGRRAEVLHGAVGQIAAELAGADGAGAADWISGDVREREEALRIVHTVLDQHGRLDVLVNNAGGQYFTPAELIAHKGWRAVWRLNVEGTLNMSEAAFELAFGGGGKGGKSAKKRRSASGAGNGSGAGAGKGGASAGATIINVTLSPHNGMPGMAHSGAARATVEALTRELAVRWRGVGVCVTAVAAGHFDTEVLAKYPASVRAGTARSVPMQRMGRPIEHAWLVALLASPLGRAFNGATVTLDGARDNWAGPWPPPGIVDESGEVPVEERKSSSAAATPQP